MPNEVPELVKDEIKKLANLPPGVTADNKAADIISVITAILQNKDVQAILPSNWQPYVLALIAALTIAAGSFVAGRASVPAPTPPGPVAPVDPTPPKPAPIVPVAIAAKGGELVLIDAAKAGGDVLFNVDTKVFDARHMAIDGKKLWLVMPRADDAKTYSVSVISFDDKSVTPVKIDVAGDSAPPVPPTPVDPSVTLVVIQQRLDKIDSRLTALEQIKPIPPPVPVPPVDPFVSSLQAAYTADGKPAALLAKLAPVYRNMSIAVDDPANTTPSKIFDILKKAVTSQAILNEPDPARMTVLTATRLAIGAELDKVLPLKKDSIQPLDPATRNLIKTQFTRVATALDQLK